MSIVKVTGKGQITLPIQIWPIEPVISADEKKAKEIMQHYTDKEFSYTDARSFAVMARLGIPAAFAFDAHFKQYGLKLLA